jgi:hypothetical protein
MCSAHDLDHIYTQVDEDGNDTMVIGYTEFNLSTKRGWEWAMQTLESVTICTVHGRMYGWDEMNDLCGKDPQPACKDRTYGMPCFACGYVSHDIETSADAAHADMCCGKQVGCWWPNPEFDASRDICWTHEKGDIP